MTAMPAQAPTADDALIDVRGLRVHFPVHSGAILRRRIGTVRAVDGISFSIRRGETLGLVGESGCGKSTAGRAILQLIGPTEGEVFFDGIDVARLKDNDLRRMRRQMQIIFQDPHASLNPRKTIQQIVAQPLKIHDLARGPEIKIRVRELLELVGISHRAMSRYPHEFSGGQRQRIGIARALAVEPAFIVSDESVSALDVSIQAQIVNLFESLQDKLGLTYLFIAHDLAVVRHISDQIAVMYLGKIVEAAPRDDLYRDPLHPYSQALLSAVPVPNPDLQRTASRTMLRGELPSPMNPPSGCRFRTRCVYARERCAEEEPPLREVRPGRSVACHFWVELGQPQAAGDQPPAVEAIAREGA